MLGQALGAVVVDIESHRVDEVRLDEPMLHHRVLNLLNPGRKRSHVPTHPSPNERQRLSQLAPSPHVPVPEEKLGPLYPVPNNCRLHRHLQKLVWIRKDVLLKAEVSVCRFLFLNNRSSCSEKKLW